MEQKKRPGLGRLALLITTMIWGGAFVLMKTALNDLDPIYLLAIRFTIAAVVLMLFSVREWRRIDRGYLVGCLPAALALALAYLFQTWGLVYTTPGKNAFLTAFYVIVTPFLAWFLLKQRPDLVRFLAAVICLASVGLISVDTGFTVNTGDALTLVCGVFFAIHILVLDRYAAGRNTLLVTALQFAAASVMLWVLALIAGHPPARIEAGTWGSLAYLGLVSTALCFVLQTFGQQNTPPAQTAILLSLEAVFGTLASVLFYHERPRGRVVVGFAGMFLAVLISETGLRFLRMRKRRQERNGDTE